LGQAGAALAPVFGIPLVLLVVGQYVRGAARLASRGSGAGWVARGVLVVLLVLASLIFTLVVSDVGAYDTDSPLVVLIEAAVWTVWISFVGLPLTLPIAVVYLGGFAYSVRQRPRWRLRLPALALAVGIAGGIAAVLRDADAVFLGLAGTAFAIAIAYGALVPLPPGQSDRPARE
jgi:hypothetical protein